MSGIYIHIPFCRKACHYCNFHFSTNLSYVDALVNAIGKDIELRSNFLVDKNLTSIYFGGGTPSILNEKQIDSILNAIHKDFNINIGAELTFECNPDDINSDYLLMLKRSGINRLSIGVQSFFEEDLVFMNRSHNARQSVEAIEQAQKLGLDNITIDLIYGSNTTTHEMWDQNVRTALGFNIPHISCYCLTIEEKTAFHDWTKKGKMDKVDETKATMQFEHLIKKLVANGYDHYEISNFGKPGFHAVHNTNYWKGYHYLGVGPSAHSYNGIGRSWTKANNIQYIKDVESGNTLVEEEILSKENRYNEYIMTGLRTMWGIDMDKIHEDFGEMYLNQLKEELKDEWLEHKIEINGSIITLTTHGKSFADGIASHFFK